MIAIIRIKGDVKLKAEVRETLERLRLRRKYSCVVVSPSKERLGMVKKIENFLIANYCLINPWVSFNEHQENNDLSSMAKTIVQIIGNILNKEQKAKALAKNHSLLTKTTDYNQKKFKNCDPNTRG